LIVDLDLEELHPADAADRILCEHSRDEILQKWRDWSWELKFLAVEHLNEVGDGIRLEGTHSEDHLEEHHSDWPYICLIWVDFSLEDFWGHIDGGAKHCLGHLVGRVEVLAEAEIAQLDDAVMKENIIGLHIAVHDIVLIEDL
jgi:hypothetical protein